MIKPTPPGELALIDQIRRRFPQTPTRTLTLGIGDDCAILRPPARRDLLVTTDFSLETRHFLRDTHPAHAVGHRTLARGLSDLAAMGAMPLAAFLSLALPVDLPRTAKGKRWIADFLSGLYDLAAHAKVPLAGGDTSQSPSGQILADILLLGTAPRGTGLRRSTARPGDKLYVTGNIGGSAVQLRELTQMKRTKDKTAPSNPHLYPQPRLRTGAALRARSLATACIDLSDGLSTDLAHLCTASHVRAELDLAALPVHPLAAAQSDASSLALHGGEDYELLFTAAPTTRIPRRLAGVPIRRIGHILPAAGRRPQVMLRHPDGTCTPLAPGGWQHFVSQPKLH